MDIIRLTLDVVIIFLKGIGRGTKNNTFFLYEVCYEYCSYYNLRKTQYRNGLLLFIQSHLLTNNHTMYRVQESLDNITLFSIITIMSFFLLAPVSIFMEGVKFTPSYLQSAVSNLQIQMFFAQRACLTFEQEHLLHF